MERANIVVEGRVQGVGFRNWTYSQAKLLGLRGWVRNGSSGQVEILVEGDKSVIEEFISQLHTGPLLAKVNAVNTTWVECTPPHFDSFQINKKGD